MSCLRNSYILLLFVFVAGCRSSVSEPDLPKEGLSKVDIIEINKTLVRKDHQRIQGFVNRKGWEMHQTQTGLWYDIDSLGKGMPIEKDHKVTLNYTLKLLDGTPCYSSDMDGYKEFVVGKGGVEAGLEEAILMLHVGDKARLILPPHLAHGLTGDGKRIPARSIIIYDIEVLSVQPN